MWLDISAKRKNSPTSYSKEQYKNEYNKKMAYLQDIGLFSMDRGQSPFQHKISSSYYKKLDKESSAYAGKIFERRRRCTINKLSIPVESSAYQQIGQSTENEVYIEMDLLKVGSEPVGMRCPYCQDDVMTRAHYRNTTITHIVALILGFFFWWLCCCIVPYITKRWKNVEHYCPNCNRFLGMYTRTTVF